MADDSTQVISQTTPQATDDTRQEPREGRPRGGGQRDGGGFRIRLSDNEMRAARALQEAFGLRSTVAVLGFALRTLAQQLDDGQLDDLVAAQKAQRSSFAPGASRGGERRGGGRGEARTGAPARAGRIDPFARPSRPAAEPAPIEEASAEQEPVAASDGEEVALEQGA